MLAVVRALRRRKTRRRGTGEGVGGGRGGSGGEGEGEEKEKAKDEEEEEEGRGNHQWRQEMPGAAGSRQEPARSLVETDTNLQWPFTHMT